MVSLGALVEDAGFLIGKHTQTLEDHHDGGVEAGVHAACNHHIKVAGAKAFHREVGGDTGRGTRCVHHKVGTVGAEEVGDAPGDNVGEKTGGGVLIVLHEASSDALHEGISGSRCLGSIHAGSFGDHSGQKGRASAHDVLHMLLTADAAHDHRRLVGFAEHLAAITAGGLVDGLGGGIQCKELTFINGFGHLGGNAVGEVVELVVLNDPCLNLGQTEVALFTHEVVEMETIFRKILQHLLAIFEVVPELFGALASGKHGAHTADDNAIVVVIPRGVRKDVSSRRFVGACELFHHGVVVDAAESVRRDRRALGFAVFGDPGLGFGDHVELGAVHLMLGRKFFHRPVGGQNSVLHGQQYLDKARRAGAAKKVADLGFHGGKALGLALIVDTLQGLNLNKIAQNGGGAVGLDEVHIIGLDAPGLLEAAAQGVLLTVGVGSGNGLALAVGASANSFDNTEDVVAIAHGVLGTLENNDARAFAEDEAVRLLAEGK